MKKKCFLIFLTCVSVYSCKSSNKESLSERGYVERGDYSFATSLEKNENGLVAAVNVDGLISNGKTNVFQYQCELIQEYEESELSNVDWIGQEDINFDGYPDLTIYKGTNVVGRVSEFKEAFLWNQKEHCFDYLEDFGEIQNPQIDEANKCITAVYRSDINELTNRTYRCVDGKMKLIKETKSPLIDEDAFGCLSDKKESELEPYGVKAWIDADGSVWWSVDKSKWVQGGQLADFFRINDGEAYMAYQNTNNDPAQCVMVSKYDESGLDNIGLVFITKSHKVMILSLQEEVACVMPQGMSLGYAPINKDKTFKAVELTARNEDEIVRIYAIDEQGKEACIDFATWIPREFIIMVNGVEYVVAMSATWNISIDGYMGTFCKRYEGASKCFIDYEIKNYNGSENMINGSFQYGGEGEQYIIIGEKDPLKWGKGKKYQIMQIPLYD